MDYGESIDEALRREVREELGVTDFTPQLWRTYLFESKIERELVYSFRTIYEGPFNPDPEELDSCRFWKIAEIKEAIGKDILTPNFEKEFALFPAIKDVE